MTGVFPRVPNKLNRDDPDCGNELPSKALEYRTQKKLVDMASFRKYNITVWKLTVNGKPDFIIKENVPIPELRKRFGRAVDRKTEVGFHAEMMARDELSKRPEFSKNQIQVMAIFTERAPCRMMCRPMLEHEHPWIPTYAYVTDHSKLDSQTTEEALMMAYGVWKGSQGNEGKTR